MSYKDSVVNWTSQMELKGFLPEGYRTLFEKSTASDVELENAANDLYKMAVERSGNGHGEDEMLYLIPREGADGSFSFYNMLTGKTDAAVRRMPNGLFSFYGPRKYMVMLGGRGEYGQMLKMLEDGQFFQDKKK